MVSATSDVEIEARTGATQTPAAVTTYTIPVAVNLDVVIGGRFPLSELEWDRFMAVLNAMKPGLVEAALVPESAAL